MRNDTGPTTKDELRDTLDELLLKAYENGVEVDNGGYGLTHDDPAVPNWDVLITLVE